MRSGRSGARPAGTSSPGRCPGTSARTTGTEGSRSRPARRARRSRPGLPAGKAGGGTCVPGRPRPVIAGIAGACVANRTGRLAVPRGLVIPGRLAVPGGLVIPGRLVIPGWLAVPGGLAVAGRLAVPGRLVVWRPGVPEPADIADLLCIAGRPGVPGRLVVVTRAAVPGRASVTGLLAESSGLLTVPGRPGRPRLLLMPGMALADEARGGLAGRAFAGRLGTGRPAPATASAPGALRALIQAAALVRPAWLVRPGRPDRTLAGPHGIDAGARPRRDIVLGLGVEPAEVLSPGAAISPGPGQAATTGRVTLLRHCASGGRHA